MQRDVRQVLAVTDLEAFTCFLRLIAGRTGSELHLSRLGGDGGISHNTVRSWVSVLEASFLLFRLPAWHRNLRKRVVKAPKVHFFDSGLVCHLLGIHEPEQLRDDKGMEVDIILEEASRVVGTECKAGSTVVPDFFRELETLGRLLGSADPPPQTELRLVYGGSVRQRRQGIRVVPWSEMAELKW
ncbi:MAG: DUF4143 domain-containing protein [Gemmatimonadota bacterium]